MRYLLFLRKNSLDGLTMVLPSVRFFNNPNDPESLLSFVTSAAAHLQEDMLTQVKNPRLLPSELVYLNTRATINDVIRGHGKASELNKYMALFLPYMRHAGETLGHA